MNRLRILIAALSILVTMHHSLPAGGHEPMNEPGHSLIAALIMGCIAIAAETTRLAGRASAFLARRNLVRCLPGCIHRPARVLVATRGIAWRRRPSVLGLCVIRR